MRAAGDSSLRITDKRHEKKCRYFEEKLMYLIYVECFDNHGLRLLHILLCRFIWAVRVHCELFAFPSLSSICSPLYLLHFFSFSFSIFIFLFALSMLSFSYFFLFLFPLFLPPPSLSPSFPPLLSAYFLLIFFFILLSLFLLPFFLPLTLLDPRLLSYLPVSLSF